jgi:coenzyme F420-reducing hydrogenase alpha subunit
MKIQRIKVDTLARVEGEGGLHVRIKDNVVKEVELKIFEPPRFFEAFLRGRDMGEVPDITARICGICPIAYQMSSCHAIEQACGVTVGGPLRALRRLLYCGEWIESHALHIFMLHAPDFLGFDDAIRMAREHPEVVKAALRIKKIGNDLVTVLGGRPIHPINVRLGGFYETPTRAELESLVERLTAARKTSLEFMEFLGRLPFPDFEQDYEFVSLRHPDEYPLNEGRIVSNKGIDIDVSEYEKYFVEEHVEHSTALHSTIKGRGAYLVGPLARYNLNYDRLSPLAKDAAQAGGLGRECRNQFQSIVVRGVELVYAFDEALRIIADYKRPDKPFVEVRPKAASGVGCTEAPRGSLYHRYRIDAEGRVLDARIVPPTAQNQKIMESDLREFIPGRLNLKPDELTWQCEQAIRNYDPCISCSCHFLNMKVERE